MLTLLLAAAVTGSVPVYYFGPEQDMAAAHACALGPREALTNRHVMMTPKGYWIVQFESAEGGPGYAKVKSTDPIRDLVLLEPVVGTFPGPYPKVAKRAPAVGERLSVSRLMTGFITGRGAASFAGLFAGLVNYEADDVETGPAPGSSGSCVLNAEGELVAIHSGRSSAEPLTGFGQAVYGPWKFREMNVVPEKQKEGK